MRPSRLYFILFAIGLLISTYYGLRYFQDRVSLETVHDFSTGRWPAGLIAAIAISQLLGHLIRASNWRYLTRQIRPAGLTVHFQCLSVGFLFNTLLPFRVGEILRAIFLARLMRVSRISILSTIVFERCVDGFVLSSAFFLIYGIYIAGGGVPVMRLPLYWLSFTLLLGSVLLFYFLLKVRNRDPRYFQVVRGISNLFNARLRNVVRTVGWSLMHSLNLIVRRRVVLVFLLRSVLMWAVYLAPLALVIEAGPLGNFFRILVPIGLLEGLSVPSGPGFFGTYHYFAIQNFGELIARPGPFAMLSWALLVGPISLVGAVYFFYFNFFAKESPFEVSPSLGFNAPSKLYRDSLDPASGSYLDSFFSGNEIDQLVAKFELDGDLRLIKIFNGGSNALTMLVWNGQRQCVRKITFQRYAKKMSDQYLWLKDRETLQFLPRVSGYTEADGIASFDIDWYPDHQEFFRYIHENSVEASASILDALLDQVSTKVHGTASRKTDPALLAGYIEEKIFGKVREYFLLMPGHKVDADELEINGRHYAGLDSILARISGDAALMKSLSEIEVCDIHGDLTVDNVIVNESGFKILDPNNENAISDPIVDYAKLYQSLHSGYEHLVGLTRVDVQPGSISFEERITTKYHELFEHLNESLKGRLSPERLRNIKFHEAVHFARMLPYRARINPETAPAFYAVMVRLFNEFHSDGGAN